MKRSYTGAAVSLLLAGMLTVTGCGGTESCGETGGRADGIHIRL